MDKPMKDNVKEKVDPKIVATLLIVGIVELEVFTVPRKIVEIAGRDAWISVLCGGVIMSLLVYLLICLAARFPRKNFFQYCDEVWGKTLGWPIILAYFLFWSVYLVLLLQEFGWINQIFFLKETPIAIPKLLVAAAAAILVTYGFTAIARFFQLMLLFILLPLLGVLMLTIPNIEWTHFLPFMGNGILPVLKGIFYYLSVLQGMMAIILIFSPFLEKPRDALKPALIGINVIFFLSVIQTVGAIGVLGVENIIESVWPGIDTISVIEMPGFPVERFELWLTIPWFVGIFTSWALFLYFLAYGVMQVFSLNKKKEVIYIVTVALFLVGYLIPSYAWAMQMRIWILMATLVLVYLIPTLTYILALLRRKGGRNA